MQIILIQDVNKIGKKGDIKRVSDGYARNFLIPRRLAKLATKESIQSYETSRKNAQKMQSKEKQQYESLAKKLQGYSVNLTVNAKKGKLFGSVGEKEIANALKEKGFDVSNEHVILSKHLKEVGVVEVEVKFPHDVKTSITVDIREK
jgi:large subunit ribosomal protein L9